MSEIILEVLQRIERGTGVQLLLHKLGSRLIRFKGQLLYHSKTIQNKVTLCTQLW